MNWCLAGDAISTEQKYGAGQNKHSVTSMNTAKLDQETEELKHDKVSLDVGKLIMKGRQQKGLTQTRCTNCLNTGNNDFIEDITSAEVQIIDDLKKVKQVLHELNQK